MKRVLISCIILLLSLTALAQGLPFMRHFNTDDYKAHAMNFDLDIDKNGIVYCFITTTSDGAYFTRQASVVLPSYFATLKVMSGRVVITSSAKSLLSPTAL